MIKNTRGMSTLRTPGPMASRCTNLMAILGLKDHSWWGCIRWDNHGDKRDKLTFSIDRGRHTILIASITNQMTSTSTSQTNGTTSQGWTRRKTACRCQEWGGLNTTKLSLRSSTTRACTIRGSHQVFKQENRISNSREKKSIIATKYIKNSSMKAETDPRWPIQWISQINKHRISIITQKGTTRTSIAAHWWGFQLSQNQSSENLLLMRTTEGSRGLSPGHTTSSHIQTAEVAASLELSIVQPTELKSEAKEMKGWAGSHQQEGETSIITAVPTSSQDNRAGTIPNIMIDLSLLEFKFTLIKSIKQFYHFFTNFIFNLELSIEFFI